MCAKWWPDFNKFFFEFLWALVLRAGRREERRRFVAMGQEEGRKNVARGCRPVTEMRREIGRTQRGLTAATTKIED